ncbi:MAG TPA: GGDEF domain-containing protein [Chloroflexota bacterium]|nr:GGDEF domain-containing protein [Chloroflexota bacterium]
MNYPPTFELPTTNTLTGLLSDAYFRYLLRETMLPQARAAETPLSLVSIDLDNFLEINQEHGRRCGDHVLINVARTLQATFPPQAALARLGGDEFAAALPNTRLDDAFTLAEEFRRRVAAIRLDQWPDLHISCTIGLAAFPANGKIPAELIREADQALYVAKNSGRNKVALPLPEGRMVTKTNYYTATQLERLAHLAGRVDRNESSLLREALDDLLKKYNDLLSQPPRDEQAGASTGERE